jgi:hypothetical protein
VTDIEYPTTWTVRTTIDPGEGAPDFVTTQHGTLTATDTQIAGIAEALRVLGIEGVETLRSSNGGSLIYLQIEREDGSCVTIGRNYGNGQPTDRAAATALLTEAYTELDRHMDDPDESPHDSHGMLELTRDRLAALYGMIPAFVTPVDRIPERPGPPAVIVIIRCRVCSEPIRWDASRDDWTHRNYVAVPHAAIGPDDVEIGPEFPVACSSMHDHDPIACAPEIEVTDTTMTEMDVNSAYPDATPRSYTLGEAAALPGGIAALTGGAITGPYFEVDEDDEEERGDHGDVDG